MRSIPPQNFLGIFCGRRTVPFSYIFMNWFLREHSCEVRSIVFQCDADCRAFAKDMGWMITDAGPAHMLADIVAWANGHGREPEGAVSLDLVDGLVERMKSRFK